MAWPGIEHVCRCASRREDTRAAIVTMLSVATLQVGSTMAPENTIRPSAALALWAMRLIANAHPTNVKLKIEPAIPFTY